MKLGQMRETKKQVDLGLPL